MSPPENLPDIPPDYESVAERVRSGEYFQEARNFYAGEYLEPLSERYLFLLLAILSLAAALLTGVAVMRAFPLHTQQPFVYYSRDYMNEDTFLRPLAHKDENPNDALKRFLAGDYVKRRESYDINQLDLNVRFVKASSTPQVFDVWQQEMDPSNPQSPIARFQRHAVRKIDILSVMPRGGSAADVIYEATVVDGLEVKKSQSRANIAFRFKDITVNQSTGRASPVEFVVTSYSTQTLEE